MRYWLTIVLGLALFPQPVLANWHRAQSEHFIVYGNNSEKSLRNFAIKLEHFDQILRFVTQITDADPGNPLTVVAIDSEPQMRRLCHSQNAAGCYQTRLWGDIAYVQGSASNSGHEFGVTGQDVLFHEYTHHFMFHNFPQAYPPWYTEGFAELFAPTELRDNGQVNLGVVPQYRAWGIIETGYALQKMLTGMPDNMSQSDGNAYYGKAWLLAHYLMFESSRKDQLSRYLKLFSQGTPSLGAAQTAFGDLTILDHELQVYARGAIRYKIFKDFKFEDKPVTVTELSASESAAMPLTVRMWNGSRPDDIQPFLDDATALVSKYPDEPMAQSAAAEGNLDAKHFEQARHYNDMILATHPNFQGALLRRARIAQAELANDHDPQKWLAVRKLAIEANHATPNDPYSLMVYYETYRAGGTAVPDIAIKGLERALELSPQSTEIRISLAQEYLRLSKKAELDQVTAPMVNDPHDAFTRGIATALRAAPLGSYLKEIKFDVPSIKTKP